MAIFSESVDLTLNLSPIRTFDTNTEKVVFVSNLLSFIKGTFLYGSIVAILMATFFFPVLKAEASFFAAIKNMFFVSGARAESSPDDSFNSQNMALLQATLSPGGGFGRGGGDITVDNFALLPEGGPSGFITDTENNMVNNGQISVYVVRADDTLSHIARMFGVSVNTILWANDLRNGVIREGQTLVILPVNGVRHVVKKGDTLASIAKKYDGSVDDIAEFNNLSLKGSLSVGDEVLVPNGRIAAPVAAVTSSGSTVAPATLRGVGGPDLSGYYIRPVFGGVISQGLHGYNGVDLAAPRGTTIVASAEGVVVIAREGGYNGGYGSYIVIQHPNGTQTLYAHLDRVVVRQGVEVQQGQLIGYSGNTGRSTGPHLHFEVRGAKNPFVR